MNKTDPCDKQPVKDHERCENEVEIEARGPEMTDPYHIVVVEDDAVTRTKLAGYAQAAGHRVSEAEDGERMWRILERDAADLILLDINLPREDGLDLTRKLRAQSNVGIILVTVRDDDVDRILGLEIGADDYITKPFNPRSCLRASRAFCAAPRRARGSPSRGAASPVGSSLQRPASWSHPRARRCS